MAGVDVWNHCNFMCMNYILNELANKFIMCIVESRVKVHFGKLWIKSAMMKMLI
jgi:hypothetical protein